MPRNASGTYTLPTGNPVVSGTLIEADWANTTLNDIANELTDSLSRSGEGGMLAPFRLADGLQASPGIAWLNEPSTGFYREGSGEMWGVVGGAQILQYTSAGVLVPTGKTLTANGGITATTLTTSGLATLASASVTGNLSVGGTLTLTGGLTLNGNVTVGDAATDTLTINSTITSNLIFTDNTYDIGASGATRPRNLYLAGNGVIGGTLGVTGVLTASAGLTGNVTGNLTGNVTGSISGGTVAGSTGTFSSNVTVGGTLGVTGATTLSSTLGVTGATTLSSTLGVTGATTLSSTLAVTGNTTLSGKLGVGGAPTYNMDVLSAAGSQDIFRAGQSGVSNGYTITSDGTNLSHLWYSGASSLVSLNSSGFTVNTAAVFNDSGADVDFRVEGDSDANLLFVDASTDRVGVGTNTPATKFDVNGTVTGTQFNINSASYDDRQLGVDSTGFFIYNATDARYDLSISDSGNLGLGVTPSAWQSTIKALEGFTTNSSWSIAAGGGLGDALNIQNNAYYDGSNWIYKASATATNYYQNLGAHVWRIAGSGTAGGTISWTEAMTLDASGNLLVGTTSTSNITGWSGSATGQVIQGATPVLAVVDSDDTTNYVTWLANSGGITYLYNKANNALVFGTNNTERARITSGGDLLVGTTSNGTYGGVVSAVDIVRTTANHGALSVKNATAGQQTISVWNAVDTGTIYFIEFSDKVSRTTRGSITSNGTLTAYNTSSDRRLKENIAPADDAGLVIDAIEIVKHDWKAGGHTRYGAIAQDLHAVAPEAVTVGDDGEEVERAWGVDYSKLVPMLVKEIQSLRARVAALEAK